MDADPPPERAAAVRAGRPAPRPRTPRRCLLVAVALALALGLSACSGKPSPAPTGRPSTPSSPGATTRPTGRPTGPATNPAAAPRFLITARALALIASSPAVRAQLDSPSTTVIVGQNPGTSVPAGWNVTRAASFTSYARLKSAVDGGRLAAGTRTVLYDTEGWSLTPAAEQADPAHYLALAGQVAHAHGLTFVAAPAVDLTPKVSPGRRGYQAFLATGILAAAARAADVVVVQAQGSIPAPATYSAFLRQAVQQIRTASATVAVVAGLSTGPSGQTVSLAQLEAAAAAGRGQVQGYWLNIPARGPYCPNCGVARPDLAEQFLARLRG